MKLKEQYLTMNTSRKNATRNTCLAASLLLTATLLGCDSSDDPEPSADPQPEELQGIWLKTGYGDILVVSENGADHYQFTQRGCLKADTLSNYDIAQVFINPELSNNQTVLTVTDYDGLVFNTRFERQTVLPTTCSGDTLITDDSPTTTFEHLWQLFNDYYAFFEERSVDWNALYAELRPQVDDTMNDEELFEVLKALLEPLDDGHVQLVIDEDPIDFVGYRGANRVIFDNYPLQTEYDDIQAYANAVGTTFKEIRASYLDVDSMHSVDGAVRDQVVLWGTIGEQIGYLRVASMAELSSEDADIQDDLEVINDIMATVMADLQNTSAMIIDVRANNGGEDALSLAIAGYFTDQRRLAVSKFTRSVSGATEPVEAYIEPANDTPYLNPLVVLQASDTASAAEIFLMAMSALPQTTLVGENSSGILSDILSKTLPNGWEIGLSNEVYLDSVGVNHEVNGVPPAITAPTFSLQAMEQGRDAAIDAALETLGYPELSRN
jgi:hypothetical protein